MDVEIVKTRVFVRMRWSRYPNPWRESFGVVLLLLLTFTLECEAFGNAVGITGSFQTCKNEGYAFPLPGSIQNPCFTCLCKSGRVECEKKQCPSRQGCFLIIPGQRKGCCEVCKGCKVGNVTYESGTETVKDCLRTTCTAGVLTKSTVQCYTPCAHPTPPKPGQCCPTCDTCTLNGREYANGEEATLPNDPCVRCKCQQGTLTCSKFACPVLACPASATYLEEGECCPRCKGSRSRMIPKKVCLLGDKAYPTGKTFRLDTCTNCTCVENTAVCERASCPPLECPPEDRIILQGSCCPKCLAPEPELPKDCSWNGRIYKDWERWNTSSCQSCICDWGKVRCTEQKCPGDNSCPLGYKAKYLPGKCCPECIEEDGVCTVFGDHHFESFDGQVFDFQGSCKYELTSDCNKGQFSVRLQNDARGSFGSSRIRSATIKVPEGKVFLGRRLRIKFNGLPVPLPYRHGTLKIYKEDKFAVVETVLGLKLIWDGNSFLEVTVPHRFKGGLCGLCGNFNRNGTDDFITKKGEISSDPREFGKSWRVGGKKTCRGMAEESGPESVCRWNKKKKEKVEKACEDLRTPAFQQGIFSSCHGAVSIDHFYKSCTNDLCECPPGKKCHCEVFTAYARACQRSGIELGDWRQKTGC